MSMQKIIDSAAQIEFDRSRIVSVSMSRSQRVKTATRNAVQPWHWTVTPRGAWKWSENRGIIESIDYTDRDHELTLSMGNNPGLSYIVGYQGALTQTALDALTISSFTAQSMTIGNLPVIGTVDKYGIAVSATSILFRSGDFIQPRGSRYPYTVVTDVIRGAGTTVPITTNRPLIASEALNMAGLTLITGTGVTWRMMLIKKPTYSVVAYDILQYNGDFELVEKII